MSADRAARGQRVLVAFDDGSSSWQGVMSVPALKPESVVLLTVLEDCAELGLDVPEPRRGGRPLTWEGKARDDTPESRQLWLQLQAARAALERARDRLADLGWEGDCELVLRCGKPGAELLTVAAETRCTMIVMGAHGALGVRRPLLGPVASHVLRHFDGGGVYLVR